MPFHVSLLDCGNSIDVSDSDGNNAGDSAPLDPKRTLAAIAWRKDMVVDHDLSKALHNHPPSARNESTARPEVTE
jgi:hypothetical protein